MECACVEVEYHGGDVCDAHIAKRMQARKQFKCNECPRQIMLGEIYERVEMLLDGQWSKHRTCPDCLSIRDAFFCQGEYIYETVRDYLHEHIQDCCGDLSETKISELTETSRGWICEEIELSWSGRYCDETIHGRRSPGIL